MWHKDHIDLFFDRIIHLAVAYLDANPNRVYVMGYSAGGDGAYHMTPRMADRWAAGAMMAGYPNRRLPDQPAEYRLHHACRRPGCRL